MGGVLLIISIFRTLHSSKYCLCSLGSMEGRRHVGEGGSVQISSRETHNGAHSKSSRETNNFQRFGPLGSVYVPTMEGAQPGVIPRVPLCTILRLVVVPQGVALWPHVAGPWRTRTPIDSYHPRHKHAIRLVIVYY